LILFQISAYPKNNYKKQISTEFQTATTPPAGFIGILQLKVVDTFRQMDKN
jgi:hypothetical protein